MSLVNLPSVREATTLEQVIDSVENMRKEVEFLLNNVQNDNINGVISAGKLQIGPATTFKDGYDPSAVNGKLRTDLRLSAPLPTSITLDSTGITASTSDATKYARLDYRGLYIVGGALQIVGGLSDSEIANSGKWNSAGTHIGPDGIYTGFVNADQINGGTMTGAKWQSMSDASPFEIYIGTTTKYKSLTVYNGAIHLYKDSVEVFAADEFGVYAKNGSYLAEQNWVLNNLSGFSFSTYQLNFPNGGWGGYFKNLSAGMEVHKSDNTYGTMYASAFTPASLKELKKNIVPYTQDALSLINDTPVYEYNFNEEPDTCMKSIGMIMEDSPMEIIDLSGKGMSLYPMIAVLWKAMQELDARTRG